MDTIELIRGDSSDIYEFSSKQLPELDEYWEGSWVISDTLGSLPILERNLVKNIDIFNDDSLINEDYKRTYKIFEGEPDDRVEFNEDSIDTDTNIVTLTGSAFSNEGGVESPLPNKYLYIKIKGLFVTAEREKRVKTDSEGNFSVELDLNKTIKTKANSFFIFQVMPVDSEKLVSDNYVLAIEVRQNSTLDSTSEDNEILFRKEVFRAKLKIINEGVLSTYETTA